jgi:hypothetical protein
MLLLGREGVGRMEIVRCVGNQIFSFLRVARRLLTKRYTGMTMTKKKFAELELSLLHFQHNVEIPETHLLIHPTIQRVVSEALATDTRPYRRWRYATGCAD